MEDSKQSMTHINQHYLPESYIKHFRNEDSKGGSSPYVFNKLVAKSKQRKNGFLILKAKKICYEVERHTFYIKGERELLIEEGFNLIENVHDDFVSSIWLYYKYMNKYRCEYKKNKGYCILRNNRVGLNILRIKEVIYNGNKISAGIAEVNNEYFCNVISIYLKILIYRNKRFDKILSEKVDFKFNAISDAINSFEKKCFDFSGVNIITDKEKDELIEMVSFFSKAKFNLTVDELNEVREMYYKIHRYVISPIVHSSFSFKKSSLYIFCTSKNYPIVGSDAPFIMSDNYIIVTLTPNMAVLFSKNKLSDANLSIDKLSNFICVGNVENANEFIFSNNKERLIKYTKALNPPTQYEINESNKE